MTKPLLIYEKWISLMILGGLLGGYALGYFSRLCN